MTHLSLVSQYGVRILLAVVVSTLAGLLVTVLTLHLLRDRGDDGPKEPPHA
jgi:holin-like protein